jgi:hypothetical protein
MKTMKEQKKAEISLAAAAQQLGISWQRAWRLVLTGELDGRQRGGRWFVQAESVARRRELGASAE